MSFVGHDAPVAYAGSSIQEFRMLRVILLLILAVASSIAFGGRRRDSGTSPQVIVTTRTLDVNRWNIQNTDRGSLIPDARNSGGGVWWSSDSTWMAVLFEQGPWIIGKLNGRPAMGNAYWGTSYLPGPMIDGRAALEVHPEDSIRFHPYKLTRTSNPSDPDALQWPIDLGAPATPDGKPLLLGDGLVWSVFNNADSTVIPWDWSPYENFPHLPVEIHQSFYARESSRGDTSLLASTAFLEWTFINKGSASIDSCYIGLWTDLDVTDPQYNPFSIDTITQTGYCWDDSPFDSLYYLPKAVGYTLLYGPRVPESSSSAIFQGRQVQGYRNLPLSSFWGMRNDAGPLFPAGPTNMVEAWNVARGYDKAGNVVIDSVTKLPTRFPWSGDPLTGTGWIYTNYTDGEAGLMFFTGPFTLAPGDTQWTMIALQSAGARDKRDAIRTIRNNAARIRAMSYEEIALPGPLSVGEKTGRGRTDFRLEQNWPNPFNPSTVVSSQLPVASNVKLTVYNVLGQEVVVLVNEQRAAGSYQDVFDGSRLASGVYYYRLTAGDFTQTRAMMLLK